MRKSFFSLLLLLCCTALPVLADDVTMEALVNHTETGQIASFSYGRVTSFTLGESMSFKEVFNDGNYGRITSECVATYGNGTLFIYQPKMVNSSGVRTLDEVRFARYTRNDAGKWTGTADYVVVGTEYTDYPFFMAYDPQSQTLYGFRNGEEMKTVVFTIDQTTGVMTQKMLLDRYYCGIAFNAFGEAYALNYQGQLYKVDFQTATGKLIGQVGHSNDNIQQLAFDYATGRLFQGYMYSDKHSFYEIDITSAKSTNYGSGPSSDKLICMIPTTTANLEAPNTPSDLTVTYTVPGQKTAVLSAVAPTTKFDKKTALTGNVDLHFTVNGNEVGVASGVAPGAAGTVNYTFPVQAKFTVGVYAENTAGPSAVLTDVTYAGFDTPQVAQNIRLVVSDEGNYTLSWKAPEAGVNNGAIDAANLKYTITAYPGGEVQETTQNTVSGTLTGRGLNDYYFTVVATIGSLSSEAAESNHVVWGTGIDLPFTEDFTSSDNFTLYTVVDENQDGHSWAFSYGIIGDASTYLYQGYKNGKATSQEAKDWFIAPAMKVHKGATYTLDFHAYAAYTQAGNNLAVYMLNSNEPISAKKTLLKDFLEIPDYTKGGTVEAESTAYQVEYTADEDFVGYFAILCHSAAGKRVFLDDFTISSKGGDAAPCDVDDLEVELTEPGSYTVDITFNAPTKDILGNKLTEIDRISVYIDDATEPAKVWYAPAPGAELTAQITGSEPGKRTFTIKVDTPNGQSAGKSATLWLGEDYASPAINLHGYLDEDGNIVLEWEAPTTSEYGNYINWDKLYYTVYAAAGEGSMQLVADNITETTCTLDGTMFSSYSQQQYTFWVFPQTSSGAIIDNKTAYYFMAYGPAYELPFNERFGVYEHDYSPWSTMEVRMNDQYYYEGWKCVADGYSKKVITDAASVDEGRCTAQFNQNHYPYYEERLVSPIITVAKAQKPVVTFSMYHVAGSAAENSLDVELYDMYTGKYITIGTYAVDGTTGWQTHEIDITAQKNAGTKIFRLAFHGKANADGAFYVDGLKVTEGPAGVRGDANGDGVISMADANKVVNYYVNNTAEGMDYDAADANADGTITMQDANIIVNLYIGLEE